MSFLYPSFLFSLTFIAVPIILHLVQLRRAKRIAFSNVKFIQASQNVTASQKKLKDLLILISRILFIIFLSLSFAQPFLPAQEELTTSGSNHVALLIDNSYSMQNLLDGKDETLLDAAIQKANQVFDIFQPNTGFYVYANEGNLNKGLSTTTQDAISITSYLDYSPQSGTFPSQLNFSHLFLLTDLQKTTIKQEQLLKIDSLTQVHVLPLKTSSNSNVFIDTLYLEDEFMRPGSDNVLKVRIFNTGDEAVTDNPVKLFINEQQVAALSIDLPAKQSTEATISFRLPSNKLNLASVSVEDFPVEFDNAYYFVLAPSGSIDIVEIAETGTNTLAQVYSVEPLLRHTAYLVGNLDYARASNADVLILNGLKSITGGVATTVSNFVKNGGTVIVIPVAEGEAASYRSLLTNLGINGQLFSGIAGNKISVLAPDVNHPFFSNIFSEFDKGMQMPAASRHLSWSRATEDILKYRGGGPFLSRFEKGTGQVYLLASPLSEQHNTLVNHGLLVPLMYKMAISGYKQKQNLAYDIAGSTVKIPVTSDNTRDGVYTLRKDSLAFIPDQQIRGGDLYFTIPPDLDEAGFYTLTFQDAAVTTIALNYSKKESFLEQYTPEELRSLIGEEHKNIHIYDYGDAFSVKGEFEKRFFGVKLWKYCLILCLVFLMAEIALIRFL